MSKWYAGMVLLGVGLTVCGLPPPVVRVVPVRAQPEAKGKDAGGEYALTHDSVTVTVTSLERQDLSQYSVVVKPFQESELNRLFKNGYVNYAEDDNAELLIRSRLQNYYHSPQAYDAFGQPLLQAGWEINPYLDKKGSLLIFKVVIQNRGPGKVAVTPSESVLLDDQRRQYEPVSRQDWCGFFPLVWSPRYIVIPYGYGQRLVHYYLPRGTLLKDRIVDKTMLQDTKVYPGVTLEGLLVFPMVLPGVAEIRVVIPEVTYYNQENEILKKKDFTFIFKIVNQVES